MNGPNAAATSVIVPAFNEEAEIRVLMDSLVKSPDFGSDIVVVVAANGCKDNTAAVARSYGVNVVELVQASKVAALNAWELLDSDVLGEFRWRTVFREQGLAGEADSAAAGWGGDRYAVFKRRDSDSMLLLLRTSWDSKADATEFVEAYRRVLAVKYADTPTATRVVQDGVDVFIVEGGDEAGINTLLNLVRKVRKRN